MAIEEDSERCGSRPAQSHHHLQQRHKLEVYKDVLRRIQDSNCQEANLLGFDDQLWLHFNRLPARYALDVNVERAEDVLTHKRLLQLAEDPANRPAFDVRLVQFYPIASGNSIDSVHSDSSMKEDPQSSYNNLSKQGIHLPPTFGSSSNLEAPALQAMSVTPSFPMPMHEITFSTVDKPKLLNQLTLILSEIGLNIREAHAFSTLDGFSLDVFVVDGWPCEETEELKNALETQILMSKEQYWSKERSVSTENQTRIETSSTLLLVLLQCSVSSAGQFSGDSSKLSGIIIPGFASTQLRAWSILDCPYSPLDFNPLDLVWLDTRKLLSAVNCWLKCMWLDPYNQTDHPECKSRPDSGLSAITELDPGYITGPLSSVWKEWIKWCVEFGIEANAIIAVPYDWRLSPSMLEERDLYFHKLKLTFETARKLRGGPSIVLAHSLGNHVFRYFLEWLKLEIPPKHYVQWLDEHIHAYFAVGAPLLGSSQTVKATLSGDTFGLPISEGTARLLVNSFASSLWMLPFSKYCRSDNAYWKHFSGVTRRGHQTYHCEEQEFRSNFSGLPTNIINIEIPSIHGFDAYPSVSEVAETNLSRMECGLPTQLSFSAREIADGTFFKAIEDYDPDSKRLLYQLEKSYHGDPVLNPLTPWDRPPIKNVYCVYGIDLKTEVGYYFAPSGKPYPDNWIITDVIFEVEGSLFSRSGDLVEGNAGAASGDEAVPYHSLSWCKNWLGPKLNITRAPQSEHDGSDVQVELNVEHHGEDIVPNMTRSTRTKYITFYEDSESIPGRRTAVWELDKGT